MGIPSRSVRLGLVKLRRDRKEDQAELSGDEKKEEAAMRAAWSDFIWQQSEADFTVKRSGGYKGTGHPFEAEMSKALRWYWDQLKWQDQAADQASDKGISWRELAIDFWSATGRGHCQVPAQHMCHDDAQAHVRGLRLGIASFGEGGERAQRLGVVRKMWPHLLAGTLWPEGGGG